MGNCVRLWIVLGACMLSFSESYATPLKVSVASEAAILINAENGNVLFEKNADASLFPASITKIASALYILDKYPHRLGEQARASSTALTWAAVHLKRGQPSRYPSYYLESGATLLKLQEGEIIPAFALLQGMLIHSANDATNVLAEHLCGTVPCFMQELNAYLQSKGFLHTHFDNPHGLHHPDHRTTARDMAGIAREAMKIPIFRQIVRQEKGIKPQTNKQPPYPYAQGNRLLKPGRYFYPYATGIKTGHMSKSKFTLVASAEKANRNLIVVLLGCDENEHRYRDAISLFDAAFAEKKVSRLLLTKEHEMFTLAVRGAKRPLKARMMEDLALEYYPSEEPQLRTVITWDVHHLPIQEHQVVGSIALVDQNNVTVKKMPLTAIEAIEPTLFWQTRHYIGVVASMNLTKAVLLGMVFVSAIAGWIYFRMKGNPTSDKNQS